MLWLRRVLTTILLLIAIIFIWMASCNVALAVTLFNPDTYARVISDPALVDELIPAMLPVVVQTANTNLDNWPVEIESLQGQLNEEDWQSLSSIVLPPNWLQRQLEIIVFGFEGLLENQPDALDRSITFSDIRDHLDQATTIEAAELILRSARNCSIDEVQRIREITEGATVRMPVCMPPLEFNHTSTTILSNWLWQIGQSLPADVSLGTVLEMSEDDVQLISTLIALDRQVLSLLYLCPFGLLSLVVFLFIRTRYQFGRWIGLSVILAGLATLSLTVVVQWIALNGTSDLINSTSQVGTFFTFLALGFVRSATMQASGAVLIQGGLILFIGFLIFLLSVGQKTQQGHQTDQPTSHGQTA